MKAAEPLYGGNFAVLNLSEQLRNFVLSKNKIAFFILQFEMRAADVAGVGLCVKTTIKGIFIFLQTVRAHRECFHARLRTVIGKMRRDGIARTAVRAVDKRITIPTIIFVGEFLEARFTDGGIGRDNRAD